MVTRRPKTVEVRDESTTIEDKDKATAKGEFVGALVSVLCLYFVMYKTMSFVCCVYVFVMLFMCWNVCLTKSTILLV